jgi:sugar phosphate isomerase/epimerase
MNPKVIMQSQTRRGFIQTTALASAALAIPASASQKGAKTKMFKNLGGGHIGLKANQKEAIALAAKYGFGGVTPSIGELAKMSSAQRKEAVAMLKEKGLRWGANKLSVNFRGDEALFKQDLAKYADEAKIMNEVGITRVATWIISGSNELTYLQHFKLFQSRLRECAKILKDQDIRLGLEFVGPRSTRKRFKFPFICTQLGMLELCEAIDTGNTGLLLDCWHWYTSHGTPDELAQLTKDQIVLVHINDAPKGIDIDQQIDSKRQLPCTSGVIDMKTFINNLQKIGYDGPVECEPFDNALRKMDTEPKLKKTSAAISRAFDLIEG